MASARMERTTVELADGTGRTALRATGQVVLFPGYLALYEEGSDDKGFVGGSGQQADAADEDSKRLPRLREGDKPAQKGGDADQTFPQPPPPFSAASLRQPLAQLGTGRPPTRAPNLPP